jgi:putative hydrolase of the HAD superfamily
VTLSRDGNNAIEHVIVFDLDDTLYLERDYVESGLSAVGRWAAARLGLEDLGAVMLDRFRRGARTRIFDDSLAQLGGDASPPMIARMLAVYRQHAPSITLADDVTKFLRDPPPKTAFSIITDGFLDAQRRKLRALDVYRYGIRFGICTDRWGRPYWKPNPHAFVQTQQAFGLPAKQFSYIADNPHKDFVAPTTLGWRTIRIDRPGRIHQQSQGHVVDASRVIATLQEI